MEAEEAGVASEEEDPAEAGGEQSPVPSHAAVALLRRRLLRGEGDVELGPKLQKNYECALTQALERGPALAAR